MPAPYSVFHRLVVSVSCSHMRCPVGALRTPHNPQSPHRLHVPTASTSPALPRPHRLRVPTASASPRPQRHHHNTPGQRQLFFLNGDNQTTPYRDIPPIHEAAAGPGRSEHRNVDILIPAARQRESPAGPNVPCERRTDPAEPCRGTYPQRQPQLIFSRTRRPQSRADSTPAAVSGLLPLFCVHR